MLINGQKLACNSCIRGHRVSTCNHSERDLFVIAPKGRPVKQCEHCRSARKDKSHHAKCDCGSKKHKDSTARSEPKKENTGCYCRNGTKCICGNKSDQSDLRLQTSLSRPTPAVKSKPILNNGPGHHPPAHRNSPARNPYKIPTKHQSYSSSYSQDIADEDGMTRSVEGPSSSTDIIYGANYTAQLSADSLQLNSPFATEFSGTPFDFPLSTGLNGDGSQLSRSTSAEEFPTTSMGWYDPMPTLSEAPGDFVTSPIFDFAETDRSVPSSNSDFFSPSDLPLVTGQPDLSQSISHSGESNYQSAPGLTAASSSGAQSPIAFPVDDDTSGQEQFPAMWHDTMQFRDTKPLSPAAIYQEYAFPQSLPTMNGDLKRKAGRSRHRQTYSVGSSHHRARLSDSTDSNTTVAESLAGTSGVNIGHLQNLETLKRAREEAVALSSNNSSPLFSSTDAESRSITIPASIEDGSINDEYYFPLACLPASSAQSSEFAWLS